MKSTILKNFALLRQQELTAKQYFKVKAYNQVIKAIQDHSGPIATMADVASINGISKKMQEKIDEIIKAGFLERTKESIQDTWKLEAIEELVKVMSIGNVKAQQLVNTKGVKSIEDLRTRVEQDPSMLNDKQKLGLKYHEDISKRIPRTEMMKHHAYITNIINGLNAGVKWQITGSFRRGAKDSGDIDVLVSHPQDKKDVYTKIIKAMKDSGYLIDDFAHGTEKYMGVCRLPRHKTHRRIDILYITPKQYAFALLYFTGSQNFNIDMRNIALAQGYSLSEHGFKYTEGPNKGKFLAKDFQDEEEIFAFLGLEFVEPEFRVKDMLYTTDEPGDC